MRSNDLLKNEKFKTNKLERGKGIKFKGVAPNGSNLSIKDYKNQDV
jgi:hypothetical protein